MAKIRVTNGTPVVIDGDLPDGTYIIDMEDRFAEMVEGPSQNGPAEGQSVPVEGQ